MRAPCPVGPAWSFFLLHWVLWIGALLVLAIIYRYACYFGRLPGWRSWRAISMPKLFVLLIVVNIAFGVVGGIAFPSCFRTLTPAPRSGEEARAP